MEYNFNSRNNASWLDRPQILKSKLNISRNLSSYRLRHKKLPTISWSVLTFLNVLLPTQANKFLHKTSWTEKKKIATYEKEWTKIV